MLTEFDHILQTLLDPLASKFTKDWWVGQKPRRVNHIPDLSTIQWLRRPFLQRLHIANQPISLIGGIETTKNLVPDLEAGLGVELGELDAQVHAGYECWIYHVDLVRSQEEDPFEILDFPKES